ncbi:hypothetical protein LguiA_028082 [Lonicera macranthoides]
MTLGAETAANKGLSLMVQYLVLYMEEMTFGAMIQLGIQMGHSGSKGAIWCIVLITVCVWVNFIHPNWDMFQSTHPCAGFHAASRAISGGPIYISNLVGKHNFHLLKSLKLPDGSILRCQHYVLLPRDCLFEDPLHDRKLCSRFGTAIDIPEFLEHLTVKEGDGARTPDETKALLNFARYDLFGGPERCRVEERKPSDYEVISVTPVKVLPTKLVQYAPIGLVNMLYSGGAIQSLDYNNDDSSIRVGVRGSGEMRAFAMEKTVSCVINGVSIKFSYEDHMVMVHVPWPNSSKSSVIEFLFEA